MKRNFLFLTALLSGLSLNLISCSEDNKHFGSCEEIRQYVLADRAKRYHGDAVPLASGAIENSYLNLQEKGVDEADMFRKESKLLFVARTGAVEVFKRKPLTKVGTLELPGLEDLKLYTTEHELVAVGTKEQGTEVWSYRLKGVLLPALIHKRQLEGQLVHSRLVETQLVLVLNDTKTIPALCGTEYVPTTHLSGVPCTSIYKAVDIAYAPNLSKITTINIANPDEESQSIGFLGGAESIYMSLKNLYIASRSWTTQTSQISKVTLEKGGEVKLVAQGNINGYVKDRWAFKEYSEKNVLSVLSSSWTWPQTNKLSVLSQSGNALQVIVETPEFGHEEDIRAARYVGNMAYAVTFKKTDPLFAIDMRDPLSPQLKGELKVPGFSAYLHPLRGGILAGVGFDANDMGSFAWFGGIQISLFDTKDPMNLTRLDYQILGVRGSYSDPTEDAHAFYYDEQRSRIGIPLVELTGKGAHAWDYGTQIKFSGAILYHANKTLTETHRLTHQDYVPESCKKMMAVGQWWQGSRASYDINRLVEVDGDLLSVSKFALLRHCNENPNKVEEKFVFTNPQVCNPYVPWE